MAAAAAAAAAATEIPTETAIVSATVIVGVGVVGEAARPVGLLLPTTTALDAFVVPESVRVAPASSASLPEAAEVGQVRLPEWTAATFVIRPSRGRRAGIHR